MCFYFLAKQYEKSFSMAFRHGWTSGLSQLSRGLVFARLDWVTMGVL